MNKYKMCSTILLPFFLFGLSACSDQNSSPASQEPTPIQADTADTTVSVEPQATAAAAESDPLPPIRGPHAGKDPHSALGPDKLLTVALQHQQEGRPFEAMQTLDDAIRRYPADARLHAVRGGLLLADGKTAAALESLEMAHKLDPDDAEILTNRAQAYRAFDRMDEAMADLDRAVTLDPDLLAARFNRGALRYASGDFSGALSDFDRCVALDPHAAAPYFNRASTYAALNRRDAAIADLEHFIELSDSEDWKATAGRLLEGWRKPVESAQAETGTPAEGAK